MGDKMRDVSSVAVVGLVLIALALLPSPLRKVRRFFSRTRHVPQSCSQQLSGVLPQIEELIKVCGSVGVSIGVSSYGRTVLDHHTGYADVERRIVADASTRYTICSLSKAFVAATLGQLIDNKKALSGWDENVADHIPELSLALPDNRLSLIDMLAHRSGLSRIDTLWLGADGHVLLDKKGTVTICNHLRPIYPVRSKWLYSNWMYALAGELIEHLDPGHRPWGDVLDECVLQPLGLHQTTARAADLKGILQAKPYMVLADKTPSPVNHMPPLQDGLMGSACGIRSTTGDLLRWGNGLLSRLNNDTSRNAESTSYVDTMFAGHSFLSTSPFVDELYGLGWAKVTTPARFGRVSFNTDYVEAMPEIGTSIGRDKQVFYHNGLVTGYNHCIMLVPQLQAVIVVLTNSVAQGDVSDWICQTLLQVVLGEECPVDLVPYAKEASVKWCARYQDLKDTLEADRKPDTEAPSSAALVGKYWHTTHQLYLEVFEDNGELRFSIDGKPEQEHTLTHYAGDTFVFLPGTDDERIGRGLFHYAASAWLLEFKKDSNGEYTEILWNIESQAPAPESFVREA